MKTLTLALILCIGVAVGAGANPLSKHLYWQHLPDTITIHGGVYNAFALTIVDTSAADLVVQVSVSAVGSQHFTFGQTLDLRSVRRGYAASGMMIGHDTSIAYGGRDSAWIILSPTFPDDAETDTVFARYVNDNLGTDAIKFESDPFIGVPPLSTNCGNARIINPNPAPVILDNLSVNAPLTLVGGPALPMSLAANDTVSFTLCYSAPSAGGPYLDLPVYLKLEPFDRFDTIGLEQSVQASVSDGCVALSSDTLRFRTVAPGTTIEDSVRVTNTTAGALQIFNSTMDLINRPNSPFTLVPISNPTVTTGGSTWLHYRFSAPTTQETYEAISTSRFARAEQDTMCIGMRVVLQGVSADASVPSIFDAMNVTATPSPFQNTVSITAPAGVRAQVQVFDVLGTLVAGLPSGDSWTWQPALSHLSSGVYFLRVFGQTASGAPFHKTLRVVYEP